MGETYRKRPVQPGLVKEEKLLAFLFDVSDVTLMNAGLTKAVQENWRMALCTGQLPTRSRYNKDITFGSWEAFEVVLQQTMEQIVQDHSRRLAALRRFRQ